MSHISMVLSGQRDVTANFVISTAKALKVSPVYLLTLANIIPPQPNPAAHQEALDLLAKLSPAEYDAAMRMLRGLVSE